MNKLVILTFLAASTSAFGEIVKNGGFDTGKPPQADHWALGPSWKLEETCGMNGARGIHWRRTVAGEGEFGGQHLELKPGQSYDFSAWVKAKNLKGVAKDGVKACACLLVTVNDKDGKFLGEYYSQRIADTKGEWVKIKGRTPRLPPTTGQVNLTPFVWHNATGEAWFDDIAVTLVEAKPIVGLYTDVYRDLAWEGEVTFKAMLAMDPSASLGDYKLELVHSDGKLGNSRRPVTDFTCSHAEIKVPVAELPMGKLPITLELRRAADGAIVATESVMFERTASRPERKCWIDRANRLIVDGKPFFPIGCYVHAVGEKILKRYCESAFNSVMIYPYVGRKSYDQVAKAGLKIIASAKDFMPNGPHAPEKYATYDDADRAFLSRIEAFKDHPAVIAWYLNDESPISDKDRLVRQYRYVRERDPNHPAWAILYQHDQIRDYKPTCDIIGTDPYPIANKPIGMAADYTRETLESFLGGPIWQVPQAFDWKWYIKNGDPNDYRMPTKAEMRSMGYQMIANGANGLIYYCFGSMYTYMTPAEFTPAWKGLCEISEEMVKLIPIFLADAVELVKSPCPKGLSARSWQLGEKKYLLLVNETRESLRAKLELAEAKGAVTPVVGADEGKVELRGSQLALALKPIAAMMLELK